MKPNRFWFQKYKSRTSLFKSCRVAIDLWFSLFSARNKIWVITGSRIIPYVCRMYHSWCEGVVCRNVYPPFLSLSTCTNERREKVSSNFVCTPWSNAFLRTFFAIAIIVVVGVHTSHPELNIYMLRFIKIYCSNWMKVNHDI